MREEILVAAARRTYSTFVESGPHLGVNRLKWGIPAKSAAPLAAIELEFEALAP
jgi:hypothetical protein